MAKKKFHNIDIEILNFPTQIYCEDLEETVGKIIAFDMTRLLKGKSCEAKLIVDKLPGGYLAKFKKLRILPFYIKRLVRKNTSYVESSFVIDLKEDALKIKPFLLTRKKVHRKVRKALRDSAQSLINSLIKGKTKG
jgi:ribosomal protein S3AE